MGKRIYENMEQGSEQWHQVRCGKLTASLLGSIITPKTLKFSSSAKTLALTIAGERIKGSPEDSYTSFDMQRGNELESEARWLYNETTQSVREVGFVENNDYGFSFGCSPDGLASDGKGGIEIKAPKTTGHLNNIINKDIAPQYILQMQGIMLACELDYMDFISYHRGMKLSPIRVNRDNEIIDIIIESGKKFEKLVQEILQKYNNIDGSIIDYK